MGSKSTELVHSVGLSSQAVSALASEFRRMVGLHAALARFFLEYMRAPFPPSSTRGRKPPCEKIYPVGSDLPVDSWFAA